MAKTDNLTDFLTGVANAIRTKKGTTAKINPQNFETEIGSITTSKPEQEKTAALSMSSGNQIISPDDGKVLSKVTITKPAALMPENIRKNIDIGGVVGTLEMKPEQEKTAALLMLNGDQIVSPDSGKVLSKVTITKPVTLTPENIRKSTEIGGVVGTLEEAKPEQEKMAEPTNAQKTILPDSGKTLSKVVMKAAPLPSSSNPWYKNINGCIIALKSKTLILGCNDSVIPTYNNVTSIGEHAFSGCRFTSITIPNNVTSIGTAAFYKCSDLTSVTIPNSVISIGDSAFEDCSGLTSVTIPNSVNSINSFTFGRCSGLTSITIPNSITSIGEYAFTHCNALVNVYIMDIAAWCNTSGLDNLMMIDSGGKKIYLNNELVTELVIPNGVTSINDYAFANCEDITDVTIPNSVTSIKNWVFYGCSALENIHITDIASWCKIYGRNGLMSGGSINKKLYLNNELVTELVIPNGVTSINDYAFANCEDITDVTIPNSVTSIKNWVFYGCSALTSVTIPNSVTSIGEHAFQHCSGLTSVTIGNSVISIGDSAFEDCSGLTSVTVLSTTPPQLGIVVFPSNVTTITVPVGCGDAYKTAAGWSAYADKIVEATA